MIPMHEEKDQTAGNMLTYVVITLVLAFVVFMIARKSTDHLLVDCHDGVPNEHGRCPDANHALVVESGAPVCRCPTLEEAGP